MCFHIGRLSYRTARPKLPANILPLRGQRIFGIISLHYTPVFLVSTWAEALACQERAMAPLSAMSSKQTFRATLGIAFVGGHDVCCAAVS